MGDGISETIDAFHRGRFHVIQPKGRGHRAGMDAMLTKPLDRERLRESWRGS